MTDGQVTAAMPQKRAGSWMSGFKQVQRFAELTANFI